MDNKMGGNGGSNGILMEDEIIDTSAVSTPPQSQYGGADQSGQPVQPQAAGAQYGATAQPAAFGDNSGTTSTGWENQNSDSAFRGSDAGRNMSADNVVVREKVSSNIFLGLIGAVVGALIGAVLWIVIYQLGYLAGIAGAAIIGFSIKGYSVLGRGMDVKGVILCAVLSIATIYLAHRVAFSIEWIQTMKETWNTDIDFKSAFIHLDKNMKDMDDLSKALGMDDVGITIAYYRDLFVGYALSAVVGIPMAIRMIGRS